MCGIVVFFGDAPNKLTRILTGMWSIIYRAPDSTGLGIFADDIQPVRTRKAVGSVAELIDSLQVHPLHDDWESHLLEEICGGRSDPESLHERQERLLELEGLDTLSPKPWRTAKGSPPTWEELIAVDNGRRLDPGIAGSPEPLPSRRITSAKDLRQLISSLIYDLDLPPLVVKQSLTRCLSEVLEEAEARDELPISKADLLLEFDSLFESLSFHEKGPRPTRLNYGWIPRNPYGRKYLWRYLMKTRVRISQDYDRDGVRVLFRFLDSAVLSSVPHEPRLAESIQAIFENFWKQRNEVPCMDWRQLFRQEKALNVYGLAAASVLTFLQRERYLPAVLGRSGKAKLPPGHVPGRTHPLCLRTFQQPILAQGRWAIQSSVSLENAHPFQDDAGQRLIVLNGQFSSDIEARIRDYLQKAVGIRFRSTNSSEYFAQLWGHYADRLLREQERYRSIRNHVEMGLQDLAEGSQAIDHHVSFNLKDKSIREIDEMAFIRAMRQMIRDGGQVAVTGMSQLSPETLLVASHNRPLFIVKRLDTADFMVVSDINAALGLFPQSLIQDASLELRKILDSRAKHSLIVEEEDGRSRQPASADEEEQALRDRERAILDRFRVAVYALEGEEIFARIRTMASRDGVTRSLEISDFEGNPLPEITQRLTTLTPIQIKKDLNMTFYETHLREVPERMKDILAHYLPDDSGSAFPQFAIEKRFLRRRFGQRFASLNRIILCGTGAAYNMAAIAKNLFQKLLPELPVAVLSPVEIDAPERTFNPDRDLVVLLSWSGTTADMVQLANDLKRHHVAMIGITEKPFGDMGLITRKSGGTVPILSGEEVTVSNVKSSLCLLFCLELFCISLTAELGGSEQPQPVLRDLAALPETIRGLLAQEEAKAFCQEQAARTSWCRSHIVIDAVYSFGTGPEFARKLEENSWTSMGKTLDYRDVEMELLQRWGRDSLVVVNATNEERLDEALGIMQRLKEASIPFLAISFEHEEQKTVRTLSQGSCIFLPKTTDTLQPFIDLSFAYLFGLSYGLAHGRKAGESPRNLAKSVTASRSRPKKVRSASRELQLLEQMNGFWRKAAPRKAAGTNGRQSLWEEEAVSSWERRYFEDMRRLGEILGSDAPLEHLLESLPERFEALAELILKQLPIDGEIVLAPLDRAAAATARNIAQQWSTFLGFPIRVDSPGRRMPPCSENSLLIVLATRPPQPESLQDAFTGETVQRLWFGPPLPRELESLFSDSFGCALLRAQSLSCEQCLLYSALSQFFISIWESGDPAGSAILKEHFRTAATVVQTILNGRSLRRAIELTAQENRRYGTALFIGPASGNGLAWIRRFDRTGARLMEWYPFGESAHGPLVTIDPRVGEKFVPLRSRKAMEADYGRNTLIDWEKRYLNGKSVDAFLKNPDKPSGKLNVRPFFAEDAWYLPVVRQSYDTAEDNLVIIDATSQRHFGQALDDLATFGCRFARLTLISQEALLTGPRVNALAEHPISHLLLLPLPERRPQAPVQPISEFLLPLAMNMIGISLAAVARQDVEAG